MITNRIKKGRVTTERKLNLKIVGFRRIKELSKEISQLAKNEEDSVTKQRGQSGKIR